MFTLLLESAGRRKANARWVSASVLVHLVLLAPAVLYSRPADDRMVPADRATALIWVAPRATDRAAASSGGTSDDNALHSVEAPRMPRLGETAHIDLPDVVAADIATGTGEVPSVLPTTVFGGRDGPAGSSGGGEAPRWAAQVERVALPLPGNPVPVYPEVLRSAGIEGSATLRFVIDTAGAVERGSAVVIRTDHTLFTAAAMRALATHRFLPAEVGGLKVRMLVEQRFEFAIHAGR